MPLGPLAPDRIGEIVECPHCHEHALRVEDFKDPMSGSKETETIYIHCEGMVLQRKLEGDGLVEEYLTTTKACPVKDNPKKLNAHRRNIALRIFDPNHVIVSAGQIAP
jgi:hypothetical protein